MTEWYVYQDCLGHRHRLHLVRYRKITENCPDPFQVDKLWCVLRREIGTWEWRKTLNEMRDSGGGRWSCRKASGYMMPLQGLWTDESGCKQIHNSFVNVWRGGPIIKCFSESPLLIVFCRRSVAKQPHRLDAIESQDSSERRFNNKKRKTSESIEINGGTFSFKCAVIVINNWLYEHYKWGATGLETETETETGWLRGCE